MKKESKDKTDKSKINKKRGTKKSPEYYIKLYTYILRDLSENIKERSEPIIPSLNDENEVKKVLSRKKMHQLLKSY